MQDFELKVRETLVDNGISQERFIADLLKMQKGHEVKPAFTYGKIKACIRTDRSQSFTPEQRQVILEYFSDLGIEFDAYEKPELAEAYRVISGEYLLMHNRNRTPFPGHTDVVHSRLISISPQASEVSSFKSLGFDTDNSLYRPRSGKLVVHIGYRPLSALLVLSEMKRTRAPGCYLLSVAEDESDPNETVLYGNGTGFDNPTGDHPVSVRALAIPLHWLGLAEPDCISPQTVGFAAFNLIASYLRAPISGSAERLLTEPRIYAADETPTDLSTLCHQIRDELQEFLEKSEETSE